jgi:hypothetical protein
LKTIKGNATRELLDDTILFHFEAFAGSICPPFGQLALLVVQPSSRIKSVLEGTL